MDEKLQDFQESAKRVRQQLLELKIQALQLQKSLAAFQDENSYTGKALSLSENSQLLDVKVKSKDQIAKPAFHLLQY